VSERSGCVESFGASWNQWPLMGTTWWVGSMGLTGVVMMSPAFDLLRVTSMGVLGLGVSVSLILTRPVSGE